jgi:transposase
VPRTTIVEISLTEQAQMLAEVRRARYGYLLALHILLLCSRSTVYRVVQAYRAGQWVGLAGKEGAMEYSPRRCTLLSPSLKRSLSGILQSAPRLCGWCRTRWSGAPVALELCVQRQITVSGETVRRWLHDLGWEWKRAKLAANVTPSAAKALLDTTCPAHGAARRRM